MGLVCPTTQQRGPCRCSRESKGQSEWFLETKSEGGNRQPMRAYKGLYRNWIFIPKVCFGNDWMVLSREVL